MPPTYYRGCWHVVSRGFLAGYRHRQGISSLPYSSPATAVYTPKGFVPHAASLDQGFPHCPRFPTAASRRSGARVSVPLWPTTLSGRLPVVGLVGRYPTNYLMGRGPLLRRGKRPFPPPTCVDGAYGVLARVSPGYPPPEGRLPTCYSPVRRWVLLPKGEFPPLDLHVLGTPPAFTLSQDQTLHIRFDPAQQNRGAAIHISMTRGQKP